MGKKGWKKGWSGGWIAPIFIVLALVSIWLLLYYLPADIFGSQWETFRGNMWTYLPWLVVFALGLYTLRYLVIKK